MLTHAHPVSHPRPSAAIVVGGSAGAIEALFAIEALRTGNLPPQLNLQTPIPEIAPALVGAKESSSDRQHVMSVNLGFGGSNAALIFSRSASP